MDERNIVKLSDILIEKIGILEWQLEQAGKEKQAMEARIQMLDTRARELEIQLEAAVAAKGEHNE